MGPGTVDVTKLVRFIWFGDIHVYESFKFIGFQSVFVSPGYLKAVWPFFLGAFEPG